MKGVTFFFLQKQNDIHSKLIEYIIWYR